MIIGVSQPPTPCPPVDSGATRPASLLLSGSENAISGESQTDKTVFGFFFLSSFGKGHRSLIFFPSGRRPKMDFGAQISTSAYKCAAFSLFPTKALPLFLNFFSLQQMMTLPLLSARTTKKKTDTSAFLLELPVYDWAGGEQRYPSNKYLTS